MAIKESILPEFDQEMATTRKLLELVPEDRADWRPHPKSMTLGRLAIHLAELPSWVASILTAPSFDTAPPEGRSYQPPEFQSRAKVVASFDESVSQARAAIVSQSDADLMTPWTLKNGGKDVFTIPRVGVLRTLLLNHVIHHRGQFTVYLRLCDVPLPSVYGPTADAR